MKTVGGNMIASIFGDEVSNNLDQQIEFCKKNKVAFLELRSINDKSIIDFDINVIKKIVKKFKSNGIKVSSLGTSIGKKLYESRDEDEKILIKAIKIAKIFECSRLRIFSYFFCENRYQIYQWIKNMSYIAQKENVILCIENEKNTNFQTIEDGLNLINLLGKQAYFVFDPANFVQCGENALIAYQKLEEYISYIHLKDVNKKGINVLLGDGIANIKSILKQYLKKDRENKGITLEPHLAKFEYLRSIDEIKNFKDIEYKEELMELSMKRVNQLSGIKIYYLK